MKVYKVTQLYLSSAHYVQGLKNARAIVAAGAPNFAVDCTDVGAKSTTTGWGLCVESKEVWSDPLMHLWPGQFTDQGRIAVKYARRGLVCPFDSRIYEKGTDTLLSDQKLDTIDPMGCFYDCALFGNTKNKALLKPNREKALSMYDNLIAVRVI